MTGMIKCVCGFAGARVIAKSRTRVSEINSSSYYCESPLSETYVTRLCKEQTGLQRQKEKQAM